MRPTRLMGLLALTLTLVLLSAADARQARPDTKPKPPPKKVDKPKTDKGKTDKTPADKGKAKPKVDFANIADVQADVTLLNVVIALQLRRSQMVRLQAEAPKTMQEAPPRKLVKVSEEFSTTLTNLRSALLVDDEEKVLKLSADLEKLREKENPDIDDVEITPAARKAAPAFLHSLTARQVAGYLATLPEFPDPIENMVNGISQTRKVRGADWQKLRDDLAEEVGWLVAGLDTAAEERVREKAKALLDKAAAITDKDFTAERPKLDREIRALMGGLGPTEILRNYMERVVAEVLSNHRLTFVLESRLKRKP
ncbi:MAG: hypothetical protein U0736_20490 [Gemmataceae bacterium]